jgi:hypothetical protein
MIYNENVPLDMEVTGNNNCITYLTGKKICATLLRQ